MSMIAFPYVRQPCAKLSYILVMAISLTFILILDVHEPAKSVEAERLFTLHSEKAVISNEATGSSNDTDSNKTTDSDKTRRTLHTDTLSGDTCVTYDKSSLLVSITCKSATLTDLDKALNNPSILKKENGSIWLLNSNLTVAEGANLSINSNDTKWLRINSTTPESAYHIIVKGNMKIDSVKISSWNTTSNNYSMTNGTVHRASIAILPGASGKMDITNSELAYLGYASSPRQGLYYGAGAGSMIRNNTIHHMYYGFYSKNVGNITIENNHIYNDIKYGIDPHTGTHDMMIHNNTVHDNGHIGIICSLDCKKITIDGNKVFNNTNAGIMLSKNVQNSVVKNNRVEREATSISLSESTNNEIYNNTIYDSPFGIQAKFGSSRNNIINNSISNATRYGIQLVNGPLENTVIHNTVIDPGQYGICISRGGDHNNITENSIVNSGRHGICVDNPGSENEINLNHINGATGYGIYVTNSNVRNNTFVNNEMQNVKVGIVVSNNTDSTFLENYIGPVQQVEYIVADNSSLKLKSTVFSSDKLRSLDGNNSISISDSGVIDALISADKNKTSFDTNKNIYTFQLPDRATATLTSVG